MLKFGKVAVTGGLSAGKTVVCNFFKQFNAYVVSADEIVHQLLTLKSSVGRQVAELFGHEVIHEGELNRKRIAAKAFKNPLLLKKLEECLYPAVFELIERHYQEAKDLNPPLFVVEVPKLFEAGMEDWFDAVITVTADADVARKRYEGKGGSIKEYDERMANQMPIENKIKHATYVIQNNGDLATLQESVANLFHVLTQEELHPK